MEQAKSNNNGAPGLIAILITYGAIITGVVNSLVMKQQDMQSMIVGTSVIPYVEPYFQTMLVFFANCLLLGVYYLLMSTNTSFRGDVMNRSEAASKPKLPIFAAILPAFIDFWGLNLTFTAIYADLPSILVMLKTLTPITNDIFGAIFLGKGFYPYQKLGLLIAIIGAICACVESVALAHIEIISDAWLGLIFALASLVVSGIQFVVEQKISKKYDYHPYQLVGYEGVWGLIFAIIGFIIANFISCEAGVTIHGGAFCSNGVLGSISDLGTFLHDNNTLKILVIIAIINPVMLNLVSIPMKEYVPSAVGACVDVFVVLFAWFYTLFYLNERFFATHCVGFILFGIGTLIYQNAIMIKGLGAKVRAESESGAFTGKDSSSSLDNRILY